MINIIILLIILVLIYIFLFFKKEYFQDDTAVTPIPPNETLHLLNTIMDSDGDDDNFNFNHATDIIDNSNLMLNSDSENIFESDKLTTYLDEKILNLQNKYQSDNTQLPSIQDNNYTKYNHQLRLLINSRNLGQNIMLDVLKNKINYLLGTFNKMEDIEKKYM